MEGEYLSKVSEEVEQFKFFFSSAACTNLTTEKKISTVLRFVQTIEEKI